MSASGSRVHGRINKKTELGSLALVSRISWRNWSNFCSSTDSNVDSGTASPVAECLELLAFDYPFICNEVIAQVAIKRSMAGGMRPCKYINGLKRTFQKRGTYHLLFSVNALKRHVWFQNLEIVSLIIIQSRVSDVCSNFDKAKGTLWSSSGHYKTTNSNSLKRRLYFSNLPLESLYAGIHIWVLLSIWTLNDVHLIYGRSDWIDHTTKGHSLLDIE